MADEELRERLARLGLVQTSELPPVFTGSQALLRLTVVYPFPQSIPAIKRLKAAGLSLGEAKAVVELAMGQEDATCLIHEEAGIDRLVNDLAAMNLTVERIDD